MFCVAAYAILDNKKQIRRMIILDRNRAYAKVLNDMSWLYIDPTDIAHTPEIANGLKQFCMIAQDADPGWTDEICKSVVENESLQLAEMLVASGYAIWKDGLDVSKANAKLLTWKSDKNRERIHILLGNKEKLIPS
jgi:hypothetical protein